MKKHKLKAVQVFRFILQLIFFIILPSLYISAFSGIKVLYLAIIHLSFSASVLAALVEVIAIIPITILLGRFFCGWMCAFGSLGEWIYTLSGKVLQRKKPVWRPSETVDARLKLIKYGVLAVLVIVSWTFGSTVFSTASPWDVFGMIATVGTTPDISYAVTNLTIGFVIFCGIVVASAFVERFFCRYLCPLGAIFTLVSRLRIDKIKKPSAQCGKCRVCTNSCAMGIPLYKMEKVNSGECINCMKCVTSCPRSNAHMTIADSDVRPLVAGMAAVGVMTGVYYADNAIRGAAGVSSILTVSDSGSSSANKLYNDGTYEGSGTGFRGGTTTVSVTVKNDKITNITTVSTRDDGRFYDQAFSSVTNEILSSQSTDVDAVSGATYSSNGIMSAVADALSKAAISNSTSETSEASQSSDAAQFSDVGTSSSATTATQADESTTAAAATTTTTAAAATGTYKDGTYQGSGNGFRGTTAVTVVVSGGKITSVTVDSYRDDARFFKQAYPTVIQEIIDNQSADVDAVSGATFSSNGIMQAVANALSGAKQ